VRNKSIQSPNVARNLGRSTIRRLDVYKT